MLERRCLLTALPAMLGSFVSKAGESTPWILDVIDVPPMGFKLANGATSGVTAEMAYALSKHSAHPIETRLVPIARAVQNINRGASDLTILLPLPGLSAEVTPVARLVQLEVEVLPRKGLMLESRTSLRGLRIASLSSGAGYSAVANLDGVIIQPTNTVSSMLQLLKAGRVDAVSAVRYTLRRGLKEENMDPKDVGTPFVLSKLDLNLWARPGLPDTDRLRLAHAASKVIRNGQAAKIMAQHSGDS